MPRYNIDNPLTDDGRNKLNSMFEELYKEYTGAGLNAKDAREKAVQAVADSVLAKDIAETTRNEMLAIIREQTQNGDLAPEIAQARGGEATVGDRFNSIDLNLAQRATKEVVPSGNLVDKLNNLIRVRGMYARVHDNELKIGIGMSDQLRSIVEYCFRYNGDGLLLLRGVKSGIEDTDVYTNRLPPVTLNGNFNTGSAGQEFTTNVGDSFPFSFTGTSIKFRRRMETRGGVWEFILDNGMRRFMSCYFNQATNREDIVFEGLPYGKYDGIAIFRGDDPINPPDGGTSRGYLDNYHGPLSVGVINPIKDSAAKYIVSPSSIPDFAFSARPSGSSYSREWVPQHGNVKEVSKEPFIKVMIDGVIETQTSGELPDFNYKDIKDFEIVQKFNAYNPNGSSGAMWEHFISHSIRDRNPYLAIQNKMKALQDIDMGLMYFGMLPADANSMTRLLLSNGQEFNPVPKDGSELPFGLDVSSALFSGTYASGNSHGCAMDISSLKEAVSYDKDVQPNTPGRITFRADGVAKVYFTTINTNTIKAGEQYSCENRICCISGVRFPNDDIASVG